MPKKKPSRDGRLSASSSIRFTPAMDDAVREAAKQLEAERPGQAVGYATAVRVLLTEALTARKIQINP